MVAPDEIQTIAMVARVFGADWAACDDDPETPIWWDDGELGDGRKFNPLPITMPRESLDWDKLTALLK